MTLAISDRRYYFRAALNLLDEGRANMAQDVLAKRRAISPQPFGLCPAQATLKAVIDPDFEAEIQVTVYPYQGLDDVIGADREELEDAGLEDKDITKILNFLASL